MLTNEVREWEGMSMPALLIWPEIARSTHPERTNFPGAALQDDKLRAVTLPQH
jgi:hypothetical protein